MISLLDIAPPELVAEEFDVRGQKLTIRGIDALGWATLYRRFPELRMIVTGKAADAQAVPLAGIQAQAAIIAAGLGEIGNPEIEAAALSNLTTEESSAVMTRVMTLSLPGAVFGPLLGGGESESLARNGRGSATK